jgi:hypothetical protein
MHLEILRYIAGGKSGRNAGKILLNRDRIC